MIAKLDAQRKLLHKLVVRDFGTGTRGFAPHASEGRQGIPIEHN